MNVFLIVYPSLRAFSVCPRCSSCGDHAPPCSPSGGSVLKAGVCIQRKPFVSHSNSVLVDVSLLYKRFRQVYIASLVSLSHPQTSQARSCDVDKGRGWTSWPGQDDCRGEGAHLYFTQQDRQWHLPLRSQQPPRDQQCWIRTLRLWWVQRKGWYVGSHVSCDHIQR